MNGFIGLIKNKKVRPLVDDRMVWVKAKDGLFSVKSLLDVLEGASAVPFPKKLIWNLCVSTKVSFFAWEVWWHRVLTLDQLKRKGWALANKYLF